MEKNQGVNPNNKNITNLRPNTANVVPVNYAPSNASITNPNFDINAQKRKEIIEIMKHHQQAINSTRDLKIVPKDINIMSLDVDEKIFLYMRRHWTENMAWISRNFIYALLPFLAIPIMSALKIEKIDFITFKEVFIILILHYSLIITNIVKDFFDWYFDPYILTNERIIHYEFKPFSKYTVQETMLQNIQKIEEKAGGILSNIFGYGTLVVYIEGPEEQFIFKNIPQTTRVRNMLSDLIKVSRKYESH